MDRYHSGYTPKSFLPRCPGHTNKGDDSRTMSAMSESAAKIKLFFSRPLHKTAIADTLQATGAEDRALQGCNLSADSGAKTRLGLGEILSPSSELYSTGIGRKAINPRGLGTASPGTFLSYWLIRFVRSAHFHRFCSFVRSMSPPSTSARAYSAARVSQSLVSLDG